MSSTQSLQLNDCSMPTDATKYRQVVGALHYLSLTRPNVSYVVNKLARLIHSPTKTHWSAAKRVFLYLKSTIHHGLLMKRNHQLHGIAFTDDDWIGNCDDFTSMPVYIVDLVGNVISWCSNKKKTIPHLSTEVEYYP